VPRAVEHADAVDPLFQSDGLHHLVGCLPMVVEHGVPGRAGYAFGELAGSQEHRVEELFLLGFDVDKPRYPRHDEDDHRDRKDQLPPEPMRHFSISNPK
jgi:hypothetical protein